MAGSSSCTGSLPTASHWFWALVLGVAVSPCLTGCSSLFSASKKMGPSGLFPAPAAMETSTVQESDGKPALASMAPDKMELAIALETAKLAEQRGMDTEAIQAYRRVRRLNPGYPGVAHHLAVLYDRAAMTDAARREYAAALAESPDDPDVLCDFGYFQYSIGDLESAEKTLRSGLRVDSGHHQTMVNLAVVLGQRKQFDEAKQLFEKAIGPAAAMHNIGMLKLRQGQVEEGERLIAAAAQRDPSISRSGVTLERIVKRRESVGAIQTVGHQE